MMKPYTLLFLLFAGISLNAQVVINEFSAANYNDVTDNFGDNSDWIELYNAGGTAVDLEGYYLSDRQSNPTKWVFPAGVTIEANDHLRIWASKKDQVVGNSIHTNFKLTQTKESEAIVFSDPSGTIIDLHQMTIPNKEGHSRGRETDGANSWAIFTNPTPNASNTNPQLEYGISPEFSSPAGAYNGSVSVSITSPQASTIYYTLDGSTPDNGSTPYTGPINITETTVVRAVSYLSNGAPPSFVITNTYLIDEEHDMYIVSIAGDQLATLLDGTQIEPRGTFELFDGDGNRLAIASGEYNEHGNDSWAYPQRGLDYISRDQFGTKYALEHPIFSNKDRDDYQRLILKCAASDNYPFEGGGCHIRDAYVQELSQRGDLRLDERSYEACVMYLNGEYWGLYELREKVDDTDFTDHYYDQDEPYIQYLKTWGGTWSEFGGNQSFTDWNNLHDYITSNDMADTMHYNYVKSQLNTGSLIDYIILNTQIVNSDWLNWNTSWWRGLDPEGSKKKWRYSLWDMDATFGHYANFTGIPDQSADADPCDNEELGGGGDPEGHTELLTALYESPDFYDDYINRWADLNNTVFSCENMLGLLNEMIINIQPEMVRQIERWGGTEQEWIDNVLELRQFIQARCNVIDEGIVDCYEVEGPYNLMVDVFPANGGRVQVNSITPDNYAYVGEYYGGVEVELKADANENWVFDHWEIKNQVLIPDDLSEEVFFNFEVGDTVVAHFIPLGIEITLDFNLDEAEGSVTINDTISTTEPWTGIFQPGDTIFLSAFGNNAYSFESWGYDDPAENFLGPTIFDDEVFFVVGANDSILVNFEPIPYEVTVITQGEGTVTLNGEILSDTWTNTFFYNDLLDFTATADAGNVFDQWISSNNTVSDPFNTNVVITILDGDTIYVNFAPEIAEINVNLEEDSGGTISINGEEISTFPWTANEELGTVFNLEASADEGYGFVEWVLSDNTVITDVTAEVIDFALSNNLEITAMFELLPVTVTIEVDEATLEESGIVNINGELLEEGTYSVEVPIGTLFDLEAIANDGFIFDGWTVNGELVEDGNINWEAILGGGTISLSFSEEFKECFVNMPTAFSPNGDGRNEYFHPITIDCNLENYSMKVFNRWGNLVFSSNDPSFGWDGTYSDEVSDLGSYIWVVEYEVENTDGVREKVERGGDVLLIK